MNPIREDGVRALVAAASATRRKLNGAGPRLEWKELARYFSKLPLTTRNTVQS